MRARSVALGLVILAAAGSAGIVFAQKRIPWPTITFSQPAGSTETAAQTATPTAIPANQTITTTRERQVVRPVAEPVTDVTASAGTAPTRVAAATAAAQTPAQAPAAAPPPAPVPSAAAVVKGPPCTNPNALGTSRVVEIDTTGGPGFGYEHFKDYDFLRQGEVVITFDDGPWVGNTPAVLEALQAECVKATFFSIGLHATYYPEILKQVYDAGHTVGSHTWSHRNLKKKTLDEAKEEIEKAISAVRAATGQPVAPFFRFPELQHPPEVVAYLGERNIAIFSTDLDSQDYKIKKPDQLVKNLIPRLQKRGKGIILLHDQRHWTAQAVPQLLAELKQNGFKIVHVVGRTPVESLPQYDAMIVKHDKALPTAAAGKPTSSIVRTIGE